MYLIKNINVKLSYIRAAINRTIRNIPTSYMLLWLPEVSYHIRFNLLCLTNQDLKADVSCFNPYLESKATFMITYLYNVYF